MPSPRDPEGPYPRFSEEEHDRRRREVLAAMEVAEVEQLVMYGANRFGSAVQWLTGWPVTREAAALVSGDPPDVLFVQFHNHVPNARELAPRCEVHWGGVSTIHTVVEELERRGARGRIAVIGILPATHHRALSSRFDLVDLNEAYTRIRLIKSPEEIQWVRAGAELTDRAVHALRKGARPGLTEHQLADMVEHAYVAAGATTLIHYFGLTPMAAPERCVPAQHTSNRTLQAGDVLLTEISASFWDYPGQILRTFTIAAGPTALFRRLHEVAQGAFDAIVGCLRHGTHASEVVEAASVIEEEGFTTFDDLVHGFVGGYFPPVLGSRSRSLWPVPDFEFQEGMTVVVQPNVVTTDHRAGVQTGELVMITQSGVERLHRAEPGLHRIGD